MEEMAGCEEMHPVGEPYMVYPSSIPAVKGCNGFLDARVNPFNSPFPTF
jgi:hypothetical protein